MKNKKIIIRDAVPNDIEGIIKVELDRYKVLYGEFPEKKGGLRQMFETRIGVATGWFWVAVQDGNVLGLISAQLTTKEPKDFVSWEKSTDNGTLVKTFEKSGENIYVVNLDVLREGTKQGAQYMLMSTLGAQVVKTNKKILFFESRMPGFRSWVLEIQKISIMEWSAFSLERQLELATAYKDSTVSKNGKVYRLDRLLSFYEREGFKLGEVVPNAFQDSESLNFGVVCQTTNPLPNILRFWPINHGLASLIKLLGRNPDLLAKFVK